MKKTINIFLIHILLGIITMNSGIACFNTTKFPSYDVSAPIFSGQIVTISNENYAGDYCVINGLIPGNSYVFSSSITTDYICHRIFGGTASNAPLGLGINSVTFTAVSQNAEFHISLLGCGEEQLFRTTTITCSDCPLEPPKVGVGSTSPKATLDVNGEIRISDSGRLAQKGMIRWNDTTNDFEGFDGNQWRSFTKSAYSWGKQVNQGIENSKLIASDGASEDQFGFSVSISGDYAIIGARNDDIGGNNAQGSAYIFHRSGTTWVEQAKLTASDGNEDDNFGYSVSISGDYAIIGAWQDQFGSNIDQGSAYIFYRSGTTWTEQAKLAASDGAAGDNFGTSVSISGDYAIIGSPNDNIGNNTSQGSAYIFHRSNTSWAENSKLIASSASVFQFGSSVSISGDYAIIGSPNDNIGSNTSQGSAYIFHRFGSTWTEQAKLTASDGAVNAYFGISVSISGDFVIVGSTNDDIGSIMGQGSAYIFHRSGTTWTEQAKLTASDGTVNAYFGTSVSISGDYAIIGPLNDHIGGNVGQGSAYVFLKK